MKTATALISLRSTGYVSIIVEDGETEQDLFDLRDIDLVDRIIDWNDVLDNCIENNDIEFDDISIDKDI